MKTLEEVNKHLLEVGYTHKALDRIVSFLIGAELLEADDYEIECIDGNHDFLDFINWFKSENNETIESEIQHECDKELEKELRELAKAKDELEKQLEKLKDGNPFKKLAKAVIEMADNAVDEVLKEKDKCEGCFDCLEIKAHEALDNIFASLHEGKLDKKEQEAVVDSIEALVRLGNEYE